MPDAALRARLEEEAEALINTRSFGLVFQRHLPEVTPTYSTRPRRGDTVAVRGEPLTDLWRVQRLQQGLAQCLHLTMGAAQSWPVEQLLVVRRFDEPIFPSLVPVDRVANGPADAPWHTLIEADNCHALQLLEYLYAGQVDCASTICWLARPDVSRDAAWPSRRSRCGLRACGPPVAGLGTALGSVLRSRAGASCLSGPGGAGG